jgi:hypothetical protein
VTREPTAATVEFLMKSLLSITVPFLWQPSAPVWELSGASAYRYFSADPSSPTH